jgi:hypothetical protein
VLGFHGCDESVGEEILCKPGVHIAKSENAYNWLGTGMYFWEGNPQRAYEFAEASQTDPRLTKGKIEKPFVVGAIIDLGLCCNLLESSALKELRDAHESLGFVNDLLDVPMPKNRGLDRGARFLDRAVIEWMHKLRVGSKLAEYSTVRAAFMEGEDLYPDAGFKQKNHIQLAVRDPDCIKGYFRPIESATRRRIRK